MNISLEQQLLLLEAGGASISPENGLAKKLESGKKLRIKLGADPTAPDLHLGHAIVLQKMREFQDLGHDVIFLIGDYTALIGDPSGKSKTRPPLSPEAIKANAQTYFQQVGKILDMSKTEVRYNSEWLSGLTFADVLKLCGKVTLARVIEREDFQNRIKNHVAVGMHELLYPLMQGYDSVALNADVELGGTDQTFNLLMGRFLQEHYDQEPQITLTMPILEGLDGVQKMSKSLNNYVGLFEKAEDAYGKLMSISDELMWTYLDRLAGYPLHKIDELKNNVANGAVHPMAMKKEMAHAIVARYWSPAEADRGKNHFESLFQKNDYSQLEPVELPVTMLNTPTWIVDVLKELKAISGSSEAKRLIEGHAVNIDGTVIDDFKAQVTIKSGTLIIAGKRKQYKIK